MAEALIYYDHILINVSNQPQFAELLNWFIAQGRYEDFLALVNDGILKVYDYAFATAAIQLPSGNYSVMNVQEPVQAKPDTFEQRVLYHQVVQSCLKNSRQKAKLYRTFRGNVIEVKAKEFGNAVENAGRDNADADRYARITQAFVDELYQFRKLGKPPQIEASVSASSDGSGQRITLNVNFEELQRLAGKELNFHPGSLLTAGAHSNRLLWSAASLNCDLYLGQPISLLVGDKLYESTKRIEKVHTIIDNLQESVEFPDIRKLVNNGEIGLREVLKIRQKAQRFRDWLQDEAERDRDALIAYHHEVAKELGYTRVGRKSLKLFGVIGGPAIGAVVGGSLSGPMGAAAGSVAGAAAGSGANYLLEIASKLRADWKPVVFGNWYKSRIDQLLDRP